MRIERRQPERDHAFCATWETCTFVGGYPLSTILLTGFVVVLVLGILACFAMIVIAEPISLLFFVGLPATMLGGGYAALKLRDGLRGYEIRRKDEKESIHADV